MARGRHPVLDAGRKQTEELEEGSAPQPLEDKPDAEGNGVTPSTPSANDLEETDNKPLE